jgi:ABC-type branched-subunit amino acid transport system permease subunit
MVNEKDIDSKADELMAPAIDEQRKLREALDLRKQKLKQQSVVFVRIVLLGVVGMAIGAAFGYISQREFFPAAYFGIGAGYFYGYLTRHRTRVDVSKKLEL